MNTPASNPGDNEKITAGMTAIVAKLFSDLAETAERIHDTAHQIENKALNLTLTFTGLDLLVEQLEKTGLPHSSISTIREQVNEIKERINELYATLHSQVSEISIDGPPANLLRSIAGNHENISANPQNHIWVRAIHEIYDENNPDAQTRKAELTGIIRKLSMQIEEINSPALKRCKNNSEEITTEQITLLSGLKQIEREFKKAAGERYLSQTNKDNVQEKINGIHNDFTANLEALRKLLKTIPEEFYSISNKVSAFSHVMLDILNPPPPPQKKTISKISPY